MSYDRDVLQAALVHSGGYSYDRAARKPRQTHDCSTFAFAVLKDLYGARVDAYSQDLHIVDGRRPWSNIEALVEMGIGVEVAEPAPGSWCYVQGWTQTTPALRGPGHTSLFYRAPLVLVDQDMVVQATPDGPWHRYRSWEEHRARWPEVRVVQLNPA